MSAIDPDNRALIQAIAHAVTEAAAPTIALHVAAHLATMLRDATAPPPPTQQTVDAATLAAHLGVTRAFVYEHAQQLGGVRLGNGPRPRLRFDLSRALEAWNARSTSERSQAARTPAITALTGSSRRGGKGRRAAGLPEPGSVLAIRGPGSGRRAA
jgi:hypothetical protein